MNATPFLELAERLMRQPTAPFHEHAVREEILRQLADMRHVTARVDEFGNILAKYDKAGIPPVCLFCAHMDHPAYVGDTFKGGVPKAYLETNPPLKNFGAFSMWDLPPFELREGCLFSRACDDLVGCACILATFRALSEGGVDTTFLAAFTVAEEVGLLGAAFLANSGNVDRKVPVISLETSSERPPAAMHGGVIVRVGDRTSVFDNDVVSTLSKTAASAEIRFQRCLMSGGTCEATAFQAFGYRVAGLCVALGNYHNCAPDGSVGSEYVSVSDAEEMVRLCIAVASKTEVLSESAAMRERLLREVEAAIQV